jgi:hypothetical protein
MIVKGGGPRISTKSEGFNSARNSSTQFISWSHANAPKTPHLLQLLRPGKQGTWGSVVRVAEEAFPFVRALHDRQGHFCGQLESASSQSVAGSRERLALFGLDLNPGELEKENGSNRRK